MGNLLVVSRAIWKSSSQQRIIFSGWICRLLHLHSFLTSALDRVNGQHHAPAASPRGKSPRNHCIEAGWALSPVWIGVEKGKSLAPHRRSKPEQSTPWRVATPTALCWPVAQIKLNVLKGDDSMNRPRGLSKCLKRRIVADVRPECDHKHIKISDL